MSNFRDASRLSFNQSGERPTFTEIQTGAIQRIADATELMAKQHAQLVADAERQKRRAELAEQRETSTARSLVAMRGQVTKLRNRIAAVLASNPGMQDGQRLDALSNPGWELSQSNDPEVDPSQLWQVHRCSGGRNDREWDLIGAGATPREAIDAAMAQEPA